MNTYGSKMYDDCAGAENTVLQMHYFLTKKNVQLVSEAHDNHIRATLIQLDLEPIEIWLGSNSLNMWACSCCIHSKHERYYISFPCLPSTDYKIHLSCIYSAYPGIVLRYEILHGISKVCIVLL